MKCKRCGSIINKDSRCCLVCGALNDMEEQNIRFINEINSIDDHEVDSNDFSFKNNKIIYITNIIIILLITLISIIYIKKISIILYIYIYIFYFYKLCFEIIFKKANISWYFALLPIYDISLIYELSYATNERYEEFITFVCIFIYPWLLYLYTDIIYDLCYEFNKLPYYIYDISVYVSSYICIIVDMILIFILLSNLSKRFKQNRVLFFIIPYILIPIIAFNKKITYHK